MRPHSLADAFPLVFVLLLLAPQPLSSEVRRPLAISVIFVAALCVTILQTHTVAPAGGAQWGPRLLVAIFPLLVVGAVYAFEHRAAWRRFGLSPAFIAAICAIAVATSFVIQVRGVRALREAKRQYERVLARTEAIPADQVVVSGLWWYPMIAATALQGRTVVASADFYTLDSLLEMLNRHRIGTITVVAQCWRNDVAGHGFASDGWTEVDRSRVQTWIDVCFVDYRRDANMMSLVDEPR